tara:strand:+ start:606 stop:1097 length:492 start_codon:yes stop_codon:yes gene_type:complete
MEKLNTNQKVFMSRLNNKFKFKLFSLFNLPMALISGLNIENITMNQCETSVPFKFLNKNPFKSTYFANLSMAAELSTGALALLYVEGEQLDISLILTDMKANFKKKAKGKTFFICKEGDEIREAVKKAVSSNSGQSIRVQSLGYNTQEELIAQFEFTWAFKKR